MKYIVTVTQVSMLRGVCDSGRTILVARKKFRDQDNKKMRESGQGTGKKYTRHGQNEIYDKIYDH